MYDEEVEAVENQLLLRLMALKERKWEANSRCQQDLRIFLQTKREEQ